MLWLHLDVGVWEAVVVLFSKCSQDVTFHPVCFNILWIKSVGIHSLKAL